MKTLKYLILACLFQITRLVSCTATEPEQAKVSDFTPPLVLIDDKTKVEYLTKYAPKVWFSNKDEIKIDFLPVPIPTDWTKERFYPSSVEWSFHFLKRKRVTPFYLEPFLKVDTEAKKLAQSQSKWWLITKEDLKSPSSVLDYFHGADPKKQ